MIVNRDTLERLLNVSFRSRQIDERGNGRLVLLDGDDTLWKTQELYERAKTAFAALLQDDKLSADGIVAILDRIDSEQVGLSGFSSLRFTESLFLAYSQLRETRYLRSMPDVEDEIRKIGKSVLQLPELYPDTIPALNRLRNHYSLILATKGETSVQENKIERLGLAPFFQKIYVLRSKTEDDYSRILTEVGIQGNRTWVVGNSVKSDINPALRIGMRCVLIPRGIWRFEEEELTEGDVVVAASLSEAVDAIMSRDSLSDKGTLRNEQ